MGLTFRVKDLDSYYVVETAEGKVGYLTRTGSGELLLVSNNVSYCLSQEDSVNILATPRMLAAHFLNEYTTKTADAVLGAVMIDSVITLPDGRIGVVDQNNYKAGNTTIGFLGASSAVLKSEITLPFGRPVKVLKRPGTLAYDWIALHYAWAE